MILLQIVVLLIGIGALALLLWEPTVEGVNANATSLSQIYLDDPYLWLVYLGSIPFFVGVYQACKVLGYVGENQTSSPQTMKALRIIKYCALTVIGFVVIEEIVIMLTHGNDDAAGGVFMGIVITLGSIAVATAAAMFEKKLRSKLLPA